VTLPLSLYVHWPFCRSKCPYCDFNSHVREAIDEAGWCRALLAELDHYADQTRGRTLSTIFFGGGTPSLMAPATVDAVLDHAARHWPLAADIEITLEANPNSAEAARFAGFRAAGVNRLSLGVQALDDRALKGLGRAHDRGEALAAIDAASRTFDRYSFDLIYARPGQSEAAWRAELREALALAGDHLSVYQLTIEPGTAFATQHARGALPLPPEHDAEALYVATQEILEAAGLPAYEVSNHARPGQECRHNLAYWRYQDYVGVGPGAHGRLTMPEGKVATRQEKAPETWLAGVRTKGHATAERMALDTGTQLEEAVMMGLRLAEGIDTDRFAVATGVPLDEALDAARLSRLREAGFLVRDARGLRATRKGRPVLNAVIAALAA
jgi:putative oxygen-independent coproporphyrinogen III oxidase